MNPKFFLLLCCVMVLCGVVHAQTDSSAATVAVRWYQKEAGYNSRLFTGFEYVRTDPPGAGHPFLQSDTLTEGNIAYDGVLYRGVPLNYDIAREMVVIGGDQVFLLQLISVKIDSFSVGGRRFVRLGQNGTAEQGGRFYEVLYNGATRALAAHGKRLTVPTRPDEPPLYVAYKRYYLQVNNQAIPVQDKRTLLAAFGPKKEAVRKHLQQQRLNFRKAPEATLAAAALFYDQNQP